MNISLRTALKALSQNRLQALLTFFGMSVGVAMVVIVSGLGLGAQAKIEEQIESAGPTMITIRSGNLRPAAIAAGGQDTSGGEQAEGNSAAYSRDGSDLAIEGNSAITEARKKAAKPPPDKYRSPPTPLGLPEMQLLKTGIANVRSVAGSVEGNFTLAADAGIPARVVHLIGIETAWPEMKGWKLKEGRWFTAEEVGSGKPVALLSAVVGQKFWPGASPLGKTIVMQGRPVVVVGLVSGKGVDDAGSVGLIPNIYTPLSLTQQLSGRDIYDTITVRSTSVAVTTEVSKAIMAAMRKLHGLPDDTLDDFRVETQGTSALPSMGSDPRLSRAVHANVVGFEQASWEEMAKSLRAAGRTFSLLLAAAAAVSLLVGGIGVMNIMLVSVAARTREIGLRMALGARMADVMTQFVIEAVVLAVIGGLIGTLVGVIALWVAGRGFAWATVISPTMLLLAIAMAGLTGVVFGYGPARRAAGLDPVIALRSE